MTVQINGQIEAGNHTIYLRVKEEVVDDSEELRYFDLPLIIKIEEIVTPNNIVLQQKTSTSAFLPSQTKSIEYLVKNNNNIPLDIVITASAPSGWDVKMKTSNVQLGANFVILTVPAFSQDEFTMDFTLLIQCEQARNLRSSLKLRQWMRKCRIRLSSNKKSDLNLQRLVMVS